MTSSPIRVRFATYSLRFLFLLFVAGSLLISCGDGEKGPSHPKSAKGGKDSTGQGADTAVANAIPAATSEQANEFADATPIADTTARFQFTLRPHVGDVYHYRITQKGNTQSDSMKGFQESIYDFHQTISGLNDDGSIQVEMVYDSVRYNLNVPAGPLNPKAQSFSYSTRQKPDQNIPETVQAHALIGRKVNLIISAKGEVTEVSNVEPIVSAMLGKYRDSLSPAALEQVRGGIKASAFQAMASQLFLRSRPDGEAQVNQTWKRGDTLPIGGIPMAVNALYRLAEVRNVSGQPVGKIVVDLTFSFPRKKFDLPGGSITLDQAEATGRGDVLQNLGSGFPIRKTNRIDVRLKMTARTKDRKEGETGPQTQTVSQRLTQVLAIELVDYKGGE